MSGTCKPRLRISDGSQLSYLTLPYAFSSGPRGQPTTCQRGKPASSKSTLGPPPHILIGRCYASPDGQACFNSRTTKNSTTTVCALQAAGCSAGQRGPAPSALGTWERRRRRRMAAVCCEIATTNQDAVDATRSFSHCARARARRGEQGGAHARFPPYAAPAGATNAKANRLRRERGEQRCAASKATALCVCVCVCVCV